MKNVKELLNATGMGTTSSCQNFNVFKKTTFLGFALATVFSGCGRLATIPYLPETTPEQWLNTHPHINISVGSLNFVFMEPTSTFLVYLLGLIAFVIGVHFICIRENQKSRSWWGIALILWGIGAILGGTDYQSLSYELKCRGKEVCSYLSWVEIFYYLASISSINAMVMAVTHSSAGSLMKRVLPVYALANNLIYSALCIAGALVPNRFLVSFELIVLFTTPNYLILFAVNTIRYRKHREKLDLALMFTWLFLGVVMAAYYSYLGLGLSKTLWNKGIWFNENDVLHIGLIFWMFYICFVVAKKVRDSSVRTD
ncbi:hypothetical protein KJ966_11410 [bacterium]|nr:hypothetical protein [bacterium]